jgi:hypothetical protein
VKVNTNNCLSQPATYSVCKVNFLSLLPGVGYQRGRIFLSRFFPQPKRPCIRMSDLRRPTFAHLFPKRPFFSGLPFKVPSACRKDTLVSIFKKVSYSQRSNEYGHTDLVRYQLSNGIPGDGNVTRPFPIVSHEHVDGSRTIL